MKLVVKEDGSARITHEHEVYVPDRAAIQWKEVFANNQQPQVYFIGTRTMIVACGSAAIDLTVAVWERGAYTSHTVVFVKQTRRTQEVVCSIKNETWSPSNVSKST